MQNRHRDKLTLGAGKRREGLPTVLAAPYRSGAGGVVVMFDILP